MAESRPLSTVPHVPHWSLDPTAWARRTVAWPPWGQQTRVDSGLEHCLGVQRPLSQAPLCLPVFSWYP